MSAEMVDRKQIPIIRSKYLERYPEILFGMSTRIGGVSPGLLGMNLSYSVGDDESNVTENRHRFFDVLQIASSKIAIPKQVHGDAIRSIRRPGVFETCDALITNATDIYLCVSVADCLPIFLYDPVQKAIAVVHSGWRGSKERILLKTVQLLQSEHGVRKEDIICFLGPSAGVCCYEIGEEVAAEFEKPFVLRPAGKKPHLDLKKMNKQMLLEYGINNNNVEVSDDCTICTPSLFHSYRRDGKNSGRMIGVLGIRG